MSESGNAELQPGENVSWFILVAAFAGIFAAFNPNESFWLDETITAWIAASPWSSIAERVFAYQAQSPLYYWLAGFIAHYLGNAEWLFRSPSWLAAIGSLIFLYKIALRGLSTAAARSAMLLLIAHTEFQRALISARPYSLALFFALGAVHYFLVWCDTSKKRELAYAVSFSLVAYYLHYLVVFSLAPLLAVIFLTSPRRSDLLIPALTAASFSFLMMIPGFLHLREISLLVHDYSFAPQINLQSFLLLFIPPNLAVTFCMALALVYAFYAGLHRPVRGEDSLFVRRALAWTIIPPLVIGTISLITGHSIIVGRYALLSSAGVALVGGWLVEKLVIKGDRNAFCMIFAFIALFIHQWKFEDWRAMARYVEERGATEPLILLHSGMSEAEHPRWLLDQQSAEYLTAPLRVYHVPGTIVPIPRDLGSNEHYLRRITDVLKVRPGNVFVVNLRSAKEYGRAEKSSVLERYQAILKPAGFIPGLYWNRGLLEVLEVKRPEPLGD